MSDVRPGYKLSEVGIIPEDWETGTVKEVGPIQTGPFGTLLKAAEYSNGGGVPLISVGEIQMGSIRLRSDTPTVDEHVVKRLPQYVIRNGDILFGRKGAVERSAVVVPAQDGWFLGSDGLRLRPRRGYASAFLGYQFQTHQIQHWLKENSVGTTMPSMNQAVLGRVRFPKPPTEHEQKSIAQALGDADALIGGLEALIAKKRDIKQGAMQELLTGQRRLPGFKGEWRAVTAGDVGAFRGGNGFPLWAQGRNEGDYPFFKVSDMNHMGNETFLIYVNHRISDAIRKRIGATVFPAGSIVFAKVGAAVFLERKKILAQASCIDNNMSAFTLDSGLADISYTHFLLLKEKLGDLVATTALPSLNGKVLREIAFSLPPLNEQRAIAAVLSDLDAEIAALDAKLAKARDIKQGMMQVLLTGEVRLL